MNSFLQRFFEGLWVFAIIVGLILAWRSGQARASLLREITRIENRIGKLAIVDPTLVHVVAIETGKPFDYSWRVYLPPNYRFNLVTNTLGSKNSSSPGTSKKMREFIAHVVVRFVDEKIECYSRLDHGGGLCGTTNLELANIFRERPEEIQIHQAGNNGVETFQEDQEVVLLRFSLPKKILDSLDEKKYTVRRLQANQEGILSFKIVPFKP